MRLARRALLEGLPVLVPGAVFVLHALVFGRWIIDDAGITFSYGRNWVEGYGLVAQPGQPPVEGYSNFLWMLLFMPFMAVGGFDPVVTPKLVSVLLVLLSFWVVGRGLAQFAPRHRWLTLLACTLAALNTSFVAWSVSGLENPLYVLLIALLWLVVMDAARARLPSRRKAALAGALAAAIAMTRPDGVVYFGVVLLLPLLKGIAVGRRGSLKRDIGNLYRAMVTFALLYGGFLAFRIATFRAPVPNTYWAKGGPSLEVVLAILTLQPEQVARWRGLLAGAAGPLGDLLLAGVLAACAYLVARRRFRREHGVLGFFTLVAAAVYMLLPEDWMAEYRFGTPFFLLLCVLVVVLGDAVLRALPLTGRRRAWVAALLALAAVLGSVALFSGRTQRFASNPTVPFDYVVQRYARRFEHYADALGVPEATVLLPDIGGMLYYSRLQVYDLGGLIDPVIARTLHRGDSEASREYIFGQLRPTFIHTHGGFTYASRLDEDPRFRQEYVAICEYVEPLLLESLGLTLYSGDYVRRDALSAENWHVFFTMQQYPCT